MPEFLTPVKIPGVASNTQAVRREYVDARDLILSDRLDTIEGTSGAAAGFQTVVISDDADALANQFVLADATAGPLTVTLPDNPAKNTSITVKKIDNTGNAVTVLPSGTATIDEDADAVIDVGQIAAAFIYDGTDWRIQSTVTFETATTFSFRGAWSVSTPYYIDDVVYFNGSSYLALNANTGASPTAGTSNSTWALMTMRGTDGATGAQGPPGTTGAAGDSATVSVGTVAGGASAAVLNSGTASAAVLNFTLPKGDKGDPGAPGVDGADGADGTDGADGIDGTDGTDGADGAAASVTVGTTSTGAAGSSAAVTNAGTTSAAVLNFTVPAGAKGDKGDTGLKGDPGTPGTDGSNGAPGTPGTPGAPGAAATVAVGSTTTGTAGSNAAVTNTGSTSAAVLNFTVPAGAKGDPGTPGTNGTNGTNGADGASASVAVGFTQTGAPGTNAAVNNSGTTSAAVLNFTVPQGPKGDTGTTGSNGAAATVAVGTTTTGAAGSSAAVTNAGTTSAAVLNFTVPQGAAGSNGSAATVTANSTTTAVPGTSAAVANSGTTTAAKFDFTIPRGATWTSGTVVPSTGASYGVGDMYLRTTTSDVYQYTGSAWTLVVNIKGTTGTTGTNGAAATVSAGTTTTVVPGTSAAVANSGTSSAATFDFTLPRGATWTTGTAVPSAGASFGAGDMYLKTDTSDVYRYTGSAWTLIVNIKGLTGTTGTTGTSGTAATVAAGTTTTVVPGTNAAVSNSGTSAAATFNFTIPRGSQWTAAAGVPSPSAAYGAGDVYLNTSTYTLYLYNGTAWSSVGVIKGTDGTNGSTGSTGTAATIAAGTAASSVPGSTPTVANAGSSSAATFNFTIPRGSQWYSAAGAPSPGATYGVGDIYLNTTTNMLYRYDGSAWQTIVTSIKGADGSNGTAATIAAGTASSVVPGTTPTVTNSGTSSAATFNFTVPRGATWAQGTTTTPSSGTFGTGDMYLNTSTGDVSQYTTGSGWAVVGNIKGTAGTAATVAVTSTTTSAPGTSAAATQGGTSAARTIDFTIPRGAVWQSGTALPGTGFTYTPGPGTGDMYLKTDTMTLYQYGGGTWTSLGVIKGTDGTTPANPTLAAATPSKIAAGGTPTASVTGTYPAFTLNTGLVTGDTGATPTVAAGTTTTATPGASAAVANSGTALARTFDFTIPRGSRWFTGTASPPGADNATYGTGDMYLNTTTNMLYQYNSASSGSWTTALTSIKGADGSTPANPVFSGTVTLAAPATTPAVAVTNPGGYPNVALAFTLPRQPLWVFKTASNSGSGMNYAANATMAANDYVMVTADVAAYTLYLPAAPTAGTTVAVRITATSGYLITIAPTGVTDKIDALDDHKMAMLGQETEYIYDGAGNWRANHHNRMRWNWRTTNYAAGNTYLPGDVVFYAAGTTYAYGPYVCITAASSVTNVPPTIGTSSSTWGLLIPERSPLLSGPYAVDTTTAGGATTAGERSFSHGLPYKPAQAIVQADLANSAVFITAYQVNGWTSSTATIRTYAPSTGALVGVSLARVNLLSYPTIV